MPTPVVALKAIAAAEIEGSAAALTTLDAIAPDVDTYHLMHAARGTILRWLGQRDAALAAFQRAAPARSDRKGPSVSPPTDRGVGRRGSARRAAERIGWINYGRR
jgi:predicted RNA polymerase sigma factor